MAWRMSLLQRIFMSSVPNTALISLSVAINTQLFQLYLSLNLVWGLLRTLGTHSWEEAWTINQSLFHKITPRVENKNICQWESKMLITYVTQIFWLLTSQKKSYMTTRAPPTMPHHLQNSKWLPGGKVLNIKIVLLFPIFQFLSKMVYISVYGMAMKYAESFLF